MFRQIALFALLAFAAGCSRDGGMERGSIAASSAQTPSLLSPSLASRPPARISTFAGLPDKGSLVEYPSRVVRRDGAYTWHRASLSEQHALQAIVDGRLTVTTPSGETLDFRYERHVEHPSGDWTWVGKLESAAEGEETILTFGEKAAFGTIAQPGKEPLRLTVRDGVSWLVETDRKALGAISNAATRSRGPDFFVPPKLGNQRSAIDASPSMESASESTATATAAAANTVDVVLGYTIGFATALGGQSQAVTRLNFLVDVTNQSYVNSQVDAQVRLVHTLQVDYPDATANGTALEELTGFRAPSTQTTPAAAFSALRAARNQYGGDLVSLVRKFNTPENDGCGIAWLIGGGRTGIDASDEYFGYSVVSDGTDMGTDGKTYFCRDETLAHELGHNMGSQHDRTAATVDGTLKYGVYPYSFGYKTAVGAGNFYTVMAYGETGQTRYRVFSNPRTTYCGGYACGVADEADNARSLSQAIPIVSGFRSTVVPPAVRLARNDIDGDGKSDMLWHDGLSLSYWFMNGIASNRICCQYVGQSFRPVATGDMTGDGRVDLIWAGASGEMHLWRSTGFGFQGEQLPFTYPGGWILFAAEDINGDGKVDLLWRDGVNLSYWIMDVRSPTRVAGQYVGPGYVPLAVRDFTGDGLADILWKGSDGDMHIWVSNGTTFVGRQLPWNYPAGWNLVATGDINGDRKADLMWYDGNTLVYWLMDGTSPIASGSQPVVNFTVVSAADYTGDGLVDLVWKGVNGDMHLWRSTDAGFVGQQFGVDYPSGWSAIGGNP